MFFATNTHVSTALFDSEIETLLLSPSQGELLITESSRRTKKEAIIALKQHRLGAVKPGRRMDSWD